MKRRHVVMLITFIIVYLIAALGRDSGTPNTFSYAPSGAKAIHTLFEKLRLPVAWWRKSFSALAAESSTPSVMLLAAPSEKVDRINDLLAWVEQGNRLLLFGSGREQFGTEHPMSNLWRVLQIAPMTHVLSNFVEGLAATENPGKDGPGLLQELYEKIKRPSQDRRVRQYEISEVQLPESLRKDKAFLNVQKLQLGRAALQHLPNPMVEEIAAALKGNLLEKVPLPAGSKLEFILGSSSSFQIARRSWGKGDVWIFADPILLENGYVDQLDNLRLLYQTTSGFNKILFDEFHHGYLEPIKEGLRGRRDALLVFIGTLALVLSLAALSRSIRFGPPTPIPHESIASSTEFAAALGLLCEEHGAKNLLNFYRDSWIKRLARAADRDPNDSPAIILSEAVNRKLILPHQKDEAERLLASFQASEEWQVAKVIESLEEILIPIDSSIPESEDNGSTRTRTAA